MTSMAERARRGGAVAAKRAAERAEKLRAELERDKCLKRAAWRAGIPLRTARRYRAERIEQ